MHRGYGDLTLACFSCVVQMFCGAVDHGHSFSPDHHLYGSGIVSLNASEWGDVDPIIIICYIHWRLYLCNVYETAALIFGLLSFALLVNKLRTQTLNWDAFIGVFRCVQSCPVTWSSPPVMCPLLPRDIPQPLLVLRLSQRPSLVWYAATEHALLQSR